MDRSGRGVRRRVALCVLVVVALSGCSGAHHSGAGSRAGLEGIEQLPPLDVSAVSLPDASDHDALFPTVAPAHDVLLVYFGYTSCPDVCPTTLATVHEALHDLGPLRQRVELAMISIDPRRDSGAVLTQFVRGFVDGAHALRTDDPAALKAAATPFGVDYTVAVKADGSEDVSHTPFVYAVDHTGHVRVQWDFGTKAATFDHDLRLLLR